MPATVESRAEAQGLSVSELLDIVPTLYGAVQEMLFENPTFLRKSAEALWDETPSEPNGWRNFTIPTENDGEVFEVYCHSGDRRVFIDHIGLDTQRRRFVRDSIEVSLIRPSRKIPYRYVPKFSFSGSPSTQEGLMGFNTFLTTFKGKAR